jgi:hypothetical protein
VFHKISRITLIILGVWFVFCANLGGASAKAATNLIPNPEFVGSQDATGLPEGWQSEIRTIPGVDPSKVYFCRVRGHPGKLLAIEGGPDRNGRVWCQVKNIRPHTDYWLEFTAYRPKFTNRVYLEVEIFGRRHLINQHFSYGQIQPMFLQVNSGNTRGTTRLTIINPHREVLAFGSPSLRLAEGKARERWTAESVHLPSFFPVGMFGAELKDLPDIRAAGFNSVQSYNPAPEAIRLLAATSARLGLKYLPNFRGYRADVSRELGGRPELLGFYIEDEPEGRSVDPRKLQALKGNLKKDHPGVLTTVAMLRPQMVAEYRDAADVFLLDPYPVPNMPLTWLADTIEEASRYVPRERLWAIIQAFGGEKFAKEGWPRRPSYMEMRCLTYLAVAHGAHGIFYFCYPDIRNNETAWQGLKKIVGELQQLHTWLVRPNEEPSLQLDMTSPFKADAAGRQAVHLCLKRRGKENLLILVNVIDRPVSFYLHGFPPRIPWLTEFFHHKKSVVLNGNIREELGPYEVRLYHYFE